MGVVTLARAAQYLTLSALEKGLNLRRFAPRIVGIPGTSSRGISTFFFISLRLHARFYSPLSCVAQGLPFQTPSRLQKGKDRSSICRGCSPQNQNTEGFLFPASISGWSLNPPREGVEETLPFAAASLRVPIAERLSAASSGSPGGRPGVLQVNMRFRGPALQLGGRKGAKPEGPGART